MRAKVVSLNIITNYEDAPNPCFIATHRPCCSAGGEDLVVGPQGHPILEEEIDI